MAVGAKDVLDVMLVRKYALQKVDNHDDMGSKMVDPKKMMEAMNDAAAMHMCMIAMTNRLNNICSKVNAKARYACGEKFCQPAYVRA